MSTVLLAAGPESAVNFWNFLGFFVGATGLIGSIITGYLNHRHQKDAVEIDRFEAITTAFEIRINDLEESLKGLKTDLGTEKVEHNETRELLRIALRHIRAVIIWSAGPQTEPVPYPPSELLDHVL